MLKSAEYAVKLSKIAGRLNTICELEGDNYGEAVRAEEVRLKEEDRDIRPRYDSALIAEGAESETAGSQFTKGTSETRAYDAMAARVNVGTIIEAVVHGHAPEGAEAEIQQHHGMHRNMFPVDLLRMPAEETRGNTVGPTNVGVDEQPIVLPLFARGAGAFLSVDRPSIPFGDAVFPVLTSLPTVGGPHSDATAVAETTGTFTSALLEPERVQASFIYEARDAVRFPSLDSSLRMALNGGLEEKLDYELFRGTAGLLTGTVLANHNQSTLDTAATYISNFGFDRVDGRYVNEIGDLKIAMGTETYSHCGKVYRSNNSDVSALDVLMSKTGGVRVSAHVTPLASTKQNNVIRLGSARDAVQPVWNAVRIIVDEVTQSGKGSIEVTAVMMMNTKVVRPAGFHKQQSKTS